MGLKKTFKRMLDYFENDYSKTIVWFSLPNPAIGGISPSDMIAIGREDKLCKFINGTLDGNTP